MNSLLVRIVEYVKKIMIVKLLQKKNNRYLLRLALKILKEI